MIIANENRLVEAIVELFQGKIPLRLVTNVGGGNIGTFKREHLKRTAKYEKDYLRVVLPLFKSIAEEVKKNVKKHPNSPKFWTFDLDKRKRQLIVSEAKMIAKVYPKEGQIGLDLVLEKPEEFTKDAFVGIAFDIEDERAIEQALKRANKIGSVPETLHADLRKNIARGIKEGLPMEEIAKSVVDYVELRSVSTSLMVARTETIWASNAGAEMGYIQSGVVQGKQWLGGQAGICDICIDMDGMTAPLGGDFDVSKIMDKYGINFDYTEGHMPFPPLHPNCKCTIVPITKLYTGSKPLRDLPRRGHLKPQDSYLNTRRLMEDSKAYGKPLTHVEAERIIDNVTQYSFNSSAEYRVFYQGGEEAFKKKIIKEWGKKYWEQNGKVLLKDMKSAIKGFDTFFEVSPKYKDYEVYRGLKLTKTQTKEIVKIGNTISDKGITSWSSEWGVSGKFESNVVFKVRNNKGVSINHISQFADEAEVLMPANMKFKVTGYRKIGAGKNAYLDVSVEEIL